jgi:hypothetical protein
VIPPENVLVCWHKVGSIIELMRGSSEISIQFEDFFGDKLRVYEAAKTKAGDIKQDNHYPGLTVFFRFIIIKQPYGNVFSSAT